MRDASLNTHLQLFDSPNAVEEKRPLLETPAWHTGICPELRPGPSCEGGGGGRKGCVATGRFARATRPVPLENIVFLDIRFIRLHKLISTVHFKTFVLLYPVGIKSSSMHQTGMLEKKSDLFSKNMVSCTIFPDLYKLSY